MNRSLYKLVFISFFVLLCVPSIAQVSDKDEVTNKGKIAVKVKPVGEMPKHRNSHPMVPGQVKKAIEFFRFADELQLTDDQLIKLREYYKKYYSEKPAKPDKPVMPCFEKICNMTEEDMQNYAEAESKKVKEAIMSSLQRVIDVKKILTPLQLQKIMEMALIDAEKREAKRVAIKRIREKNKQKGLLKEKEIAFGKKISNKKDKIKFFEPGFIKVEIMPKSEKPASPCRDKKICNGGFCMNRPMPYVRPNCGFCMPGFVPPFMPGCPDDKVMQVQPPCGHFFDGCNKPETDGKHCITRPIPPVGPSCGCMPFRKGKCPKRNREDIQDLTKSEDQKLFEEKIFKFLRKFLSCQKGKKGID